MTAGKSFVVAGARVTVLGYDADARDFALALARAGNDVTIGLEHPVRGQQALRDGFVVAAAGAAVDGAAVVVVAIRDHDSIWRACRGHVAAGALVVATSAFAVETGAFDDVAADVVLVAAFHDGRRTRCRVAAHRDLTRRALLRAIGYAQAALGPEVGIDATTVAGEVDRELAAVAERVGAVLAIASTYEREPDRREPDPAEGVSVDDMLGARRGHA